MEGISKIMKSRWFLKEDGLPNTCEEVEILMTDGKIYKDMIVEEKYGILVWRSWDDKYVKAWRYI